MSTRFFAVLGLGFGVWAATAMGCAAGTDVASATGNAGGFGGGSSSACVDPGADCPKTGSACVVAVCDEKGKCGTAFADARTPCDDDGGALCDGAGTCVGCLDAAMDCPATDDDCSAPACDKGVCGTANAADGTATTKGQVAGDCKVKVCDGNGATRATNDDTDVPDDHNACTTDACENGAAQHTAADAGTACDADGGKVCGAGTKAGTCVACVKTADCTGTDVCDTANDAFVCVPASCMDGAKNNDETDIDCGGATCSPCSNGLTCDVSSDCASGACKDGTCTACTADGDCDATSFCDLASSTCKPQIAAGEACTAASSCATGNCVDGVCCDAACTGTCQACTAAKKGSGADGACGPIANNSDPDNECAADAPTTCGKTGMCDGAGACKVYPSGAACAPPSCSGHALIKTDTCDGAGTCTDGGTQECSPYACDASGPSCRTSCSGDAQCVSGFVCQGGTCVAQTPIGGSCSTATQCISGLCVDGVCCQTACAATCFACNLAPNPGTCSPVPPGGQDTGTCEGQSACNGAGACGLTAGSACAAGNACLSGFCVDGVCCGSACTATCNACNAARTGGADGACAAILTGTDPDNECTGSYTCAAGGSCQTCSDGKKDGDETDIDCGGGLATCSRCANGKACLAATDCTSAFCNPSLHTCNTPTCVDGYRNGVETDVDCGGSCAAKCADGKLCATGSDCTSAHCASGVCQAVSCVDGIKNGTETDIDCGGSCAKCGNGGHCSVNADCTSARCTGGVCVAPPVCGNATIEAGEVCDDGNTTAGDGCGATCQCEGTQVKTLTGLGRAVTDDAYTGTLASMTCVNVVMPAVTGCRTTVTNVKATLGMDHTWIGDLVVKLVAPDSTVVTLMSRPGFAETADDGMSGAGTDDNLTRTSPVTFQQGAATSAENMGVGNNDKTVCQDDAICTYAPNRGAAAAGDLTTFNGKTIAGTWKLCVGDAAPGDTGTIDRVTLTISN